jgi:hypothetical protein
MHDRAARPAGAVKSAAAMAIETMILLNIDFRITQARPGVEQAFSAFFATGVYLIVKAVEVVTNMLVVIIESSENHL